MLLSPSFRMLRGPGLLSLRARIRGVLVIALLSILLFACAELVVRGWRLLKGEDPRTRVERFYEQITEAVRLYRHHPFLNTAPRAGVRVEAFGKTAGFVDRASPPAAFQGHGRGCPTGSTPRRGGCISG